MTVGERLLVWPPKITFGWTALAMKTLIAALRKGDSTARKGVLAMELTTQ